jgi:HK97 family phage major capsid protein
MTETAEVGRLTETDPPTPEQRAIAQAAEERAWGTLRESPVYGIDGQHSHFADLALLRRKGDQQAAGRLEQHGKQMRRLPRETRAAPEGVQMEYRVPPARVTGQGLEFAPPLWLNELFATAPRPSAVIQGLAPSFTLPPGVSSVNFPRITQGTRSPVQIDGSAMADQDILTAQCSSPAVPFAGMSDWSLQSLEQSPAGASLDWVVFKDLEEDLDYQVELQILTGTGVSAGDEWYGLLNLAGTNKIEYTEAAEAAKMFPFIGRAMAQVGVKRKQPPEYYMMSTSRLAWLSLTADVERPLLFTDNVGQLRPIVSLAGVAVELNDAIPNTLGAGEEDTILACRPSDYVILATEPVSSIFQDLPSGTLGVRFQLRRYVAAILGRYPSGVSYMAGSGMKVATGFK